MLLSRRCRADPAFQGVSDTIKPFLKKTPTEIGKLCGIINSEKVVIIDGKQTKKSYTDADLKQQNENFETFGAFFSDAKRPGFRLYNTPKAPAAAAASSSAAAAAASAPGPYHSDNLISTMEKPVRYLGLDEEDERELFDVMIERSWDLRYVRAPAAAPVSVV